MTDEEIIDELSRFSYWGGVEMDGEEQTYPGADNVHEALGFISEAVARMAKKILLVNEQ